MGTPRFLRGVTLVAAFFGYFYGLQQKSTSPAVREPQGIKFTTVGNFDNEKCLNYGKVTHRKRRNPQSLNCLHFDNHHQLQDQPRNYTSSFTHQDVVGATGSSCVHKVDTDASLNDS